MSTFTAPDFAACSTSELVDMYNTLTGKSIKKFSSRAAGERQVAAAWAADPTAMAADAAARAASAAKVEEAVAAAHADHAASMEEEASDAADDVRAAEWEVEAAANKATAAASGDWSHTCPGCGATQDITPAGLEGTAAESRNFCHSCSTEWFPETGKLYNAPKASPGRAAAIAASWANPEVAAARAARATVTVTGPLTSFFLPDGGATYSSVAAAFRALQLPMGKHIKFRGELKAAGVRMFGEFTFLNNVK